ncbi:MAG: hypothetical protein HOO97_11765 [Sideroxydans sp.]|nr:hypothetical protein [Sideroxydans sp.]
MKNQETHLPVELLNLATIAAQMMEDIEYIYDHALQQQVRETNKTKIHIPAQIQKSEGSWHSRIVSMIRSTPILRRAFATRDRAAASSSSELPIPQNGELFVIATRNKDLHAEIQFCLAIHIAITNKQPIIIFSARDSFIQFTRKLVGLMADIPSDVGIYDGSLNTIELKRVRFALTELMTANVYLYPIPMFGLDEVCNAPRRLHKKIDSVGLVLVDAVQFLTDNQRNCIDVLTSLIELKVLADELKVPVIALYQLDPTVGNHSATLTRYELGEVEAMNGLTDGLMLLSGTRESLIFAPPKILNAKPVA